MIIIKRYQNRDLFHLSHTNSAAAARPMDIPESDWFPYEVLDYQSLTFITSIDDIQASGIMAGRLAGRQPCESGWYKMSSADLDGILDALMGAGVVLNMAGSGHQPVVVPEVPPRAFDSDIEHNDPALVSVLPTTPDTLPFDRPLAGESQSAFALFQLYLNMDGRRSVRRLAQTQGVTTKSLTSLTAKHHWSARARQFVKSSTQKSGQTISERPKNLSYMTPMIGESQEMFEMFVKYRDMNPASKRSLRRLADAMNVNRTILTKISVEFFWRERGVLFDESGTAQYYPLKTRAELTYDKAMVGESAGDFKLFQQYLEMPRPSVSRLHTLLTGYAIKEVKTMSESNYWLERLAWAKADGYRVSMMQAQPITQPVNQTAASA